MCGGNFCFEEEMTHYKHHVQHGLDQLPAKEQVCNRVQDDRQGVHEQHGQEVVEGGGGQCGVEEHQDPRDRKQSSSWDMSQKRRRRGVKPDGRIQCKILFFEKGGGPLTGTEMGICRAVDGGRKRKLCADQVEGPGWASKKLRD